MSRTVLRASFRSRAIALIFRFCTKYARRTLAIVSTVTIPLLTPGANHALGAGLPPGGWGQICTPITPKRGSKLHAALQPRAGAKGNACQQSTCRAQDRVGVSQALERIRQAAAAAWRHAPEARAVCINVHVRICAGDGE